MRPLPLFCPPRALPLWLSVLATACGGSLIEAPSLLAGPTPPTVSVAPAPAAGPGTPFELATDSRLFNADDIFELEWASDPQVSPDGTHVVYVRNWMDVMTDRRRSALWIADVRGASHRPLVTGKSDFSAPRWSPAGDRLLFIGARAGRVQLHMRWMDSGETAPITRLRKPPRAIAWSPDGRRIAFTMLVPAKPEPMVALPKPPKGATWAQPPRVVDKLTYRRDGGGFVEPGFDHVFTVPADGGTPRQLTTGNFNHAGRPAWTPDGTALIVSADRHPDWEYRPMGADLFAIDVASGQIRQLTDRDGPDEQPAVSPDGNHIAYVGFDDRKLGHHTQRLYLARIDGTEPRALTADLDRSVERPTWSSDGKGVFVQYDDRGNTAIAYVSLAGDRRVVARNAGGTALGRPYPGGSFSVARDGTVAFTMTQPDHPADVAVVTRARGESRRLTALNDDLFAHKRLGDVEELWFESSHDGKRIHGWLVTPPGFDPSQKYPLVLEIHGGPFANYGDRFSAEFQLYAAAGYVVLYTNPRGSTSYGDEFANLIHHAYPGNDYDDLMAGVDAVLERGYIDDTRLYVTGGSGGGVLTSWIVGKTNRFRAAVVAKPVINWHSFVLTADFSVFFTQYWFPAMPWEDPEHYMKRSPLSLVGNVQTPTMLLTGEADLRTPMAETEQYYQALKLRKIDTALVRIPGASHNISARPSQLAAKVAYVLAWFHKYSE